MDVCRSELATAMDAKTKDEAICSWESSKVNAFPYSLGSALCISGSFSATDRHSSCQPQMLRVASESDV